MANLTWRARSLEIPFQSAFNHHQKSRAVSSSFWVEAERSHCVGFGEGCPRPYVTGETMAQCKAFFNRHKTRTAGIQSLEALQSYRWEHAEELAANPAAWCAMELALLDLLARERYISVEELLALTPLNWSFRYSGVLGVDDMEVYSRKLEAHIALGITDYKLKWDGQAQQSQERLERIEFAVPGSRIRVDANNLWTDATEAIRHVSAIADSIWAVEEPVSQPSFPELNAIAQATGIQVILDEAVLTQSDLEPYLECPHRFLLNLRISKCGGALSSLELAQRCVDAGMSVIVGAQVGETSMLSRAALPVAQFLGPHCVAQEGAYGLHLLQQDVVANPLQFGQGGVLLPPEEISEAGWGLECNLPLPQ